MRPFVIGGTGRSGSNYISVLLRKLGINCGHEEAFNGWSDEYGFRDVWWDRLLDGDLDGDSSFNSTPFFDILKNEGVVCFHQIRRKEDCVGALVRNKYFHYPRPMEEFIYHNCPPVDTNEQWAKKCRTYWEKWNEMGVSTSQLSWYVEGINSDLIMKISHMIEADINEDDAIRVINETRTDINSTK